MSEINWQMPAHEKMAPVVGQPKLTVIGTGYLGATHAVCMAAIGYEVLGVDVPRVEAAVRRSRSDHAALASFGG